MQNLRDKLLKAGLVTETQAKSAEEKKRPAPPQIARDARASRPAAAEAPIPKLPPLALPGSKAYQRLESLKQQELNKKMRDIVVAAQVEQEPGEHTFYFQTRKGKLRRLQLSEGQAKKLEAGELAVVERPDPGQLEHALVPSACAQTLLAWSEKSVRFFNQDGKAIGFVDDEALAGRTASTEPELNEEPHAEPSEAQTDP